MLINDLTFANVMKGKIWKPFLVASDMEVKTPAVTVVEEGDYNFFKKAESQGFPIITRKDGVLFFPNGWKIPLSKPELIKTKMFHLMKRFYRLSDEIQIADNIKIHLINDWCEEKTNGKKGCAFAIFWLLSSFVYGGALKVEWFFRYGDTYSLCRIFNYYISRFFLKYKLSGDLVYLWLEAPKDKMMNFYFYEQDFSGVCKVTERK